MNTVQKVVKELKVASSPERAKILQRFFKTGPGEYGEGDVFLGIKVPQIRSVVKKYRGIGSREVRKLLSSKFHEVRMAGVLLLVEDMRKADVNARKNIFETYLKNRNGINNWDLIDLSAPTVVGEYLLSAPKEKIVIKKLSEEKNMWSRRIAILATFAFIREGKFGDTLALAKKYLSDKEDLTHKATGWMLREVGKRDKKTLVRFLDQYASVMPRTMLRYAIEKFSPPEREYFMRLERFPTPSPKFRRG